MAWILHHESCRVRNCGPSASCRIATGMPALLATAILCAPAAIPGSALAAESPQQRARMAYDRPLPDFAHKALVEVTVVDSASRAPLTDASVLVLNEVDLQVPSGVDRSTGTCAVRLPVPGQA